MCMYMYTYTHIHIYVYRFVFTDITTGRAGGLPSTRDSFQLLTILP